jgi:hypothetical protein
VVFLAAGLLRVVAFFRVVAFLAAGFLRVVAFFRVVVFLAAGFLRVVAFFRVVAFLRVALLVRAAALLLLAGIATTFLIVDDNPSILSRRPWNSATRPSSELLIDCEENRSFGPCWSRC